MILCSVSYHAIRNGTNTSILTPAWFKIARKTGILSLGWHPRQEKDKTEFKIVHKATRKTHHYISQDAISILR